MSTLNLFPARIAFVNPDGTLTAEAYRALTVLFARVGGPLGDNGVDVFGSVFGVANETGILSTLQTDVVQPANFGTDYYGDVVQSPAVDMSFADVIQPSSKDREAGTFTTIDVSGNAVIGGTLRLAAGTVGLPSLYWSTDTTTGFYRIGANNNGYSVSGVKVVDFLSTGLTITGSLSATSNLRLQRSTGSLMLTIANFGDTLGGAVTDNLTIGNAGGGNVNIAANSATVIALSSTGAAVTGAISATSTITLNERLLTSGNYVILGKSTNNALRVFPQADATGVEIAATDSTGVVAFKPLAINGSTTTLKNSAGGGQVVCSGAAVTVTGLTVAGGAQFITTNTALNNAAGAASGTLLNAPVAGNPTKWIGINDNGTVRYLPSW